MFVESFLNIPWEYLVPRNLVDLINPKIILINVIFPAPFGPIKAVLPGLIVKDKSSSAKILFSYILVILLIKIN